MKKFIPAVLLCGCAFGRIALAQPAGHGKVAPEKPAPVVVLMEAKPSGLGTALLPRGARLLRSGTAPIGNGGNPVWLLFVGRKPNAKLKRPDTVSEDALFVDLKVATRRKSGRKWLWRTVRTIPLGFCDDFSWQDAKVRWLNPALKSGPIVSVPRDESDELLVFPTGWQQPKAVRQVFQRSASSIEAIAYLFDSLDEKGQLMVRREFSERNDMGGDYTYTNMKWNGKEWKEELKVDSAASPSSTN